MCLHFLRMLWCTERGHRKQRKAKTELLLRQERDNRDEADIHSVLQRSVLHERTFVFECLYSHILSPPHLKPAVWLFWKPVRFSELRKNRNLKSANFRLKSLHQLHKKTIDLSVVKLSQTPSSTTDKCLVFMCAWWRLFSRNLRFKNLYSYVLTRINDHLSTDCSVLPY